MAPGDLTCQTFRLQASPQGSAVSPWFDLPILCLSPVGSIEFLKAVSDPEGGEWMISVVTEPVNSVQHRPLAVGIKQGGGLIQEKQAGIAGQGASNRQTLFLTTAEGVDGPRCQPIQPKLIKQLINAADPVAPIGGGCQAEQEI